MRPRVRQATRLWYAQCLNSLVRPAFGGKRLADVRSVDVQTLYASLKARGISDRTVRHTHSILCDAFKQAIRWDMLVRNPANLDKPPSVTRREMRTFSIEEAARFRAAAATDRWAVLFDLALSTGMRPAEYFGLQWRYVDLERGVASVQRTIYCPPGGGWVFSEPKTSRSRRTIPLPATLVRSLLAHWSRQAEHRLRVGSYYLNHDLVFAVDNGNPLALTNCTKHFKRVLRRAGLDTSFTLYCLRHSFATLMLQAGVNAKLISDWMGHASVAFTMDTYAHVLPPMRDEVAEKIEKVFFA